MKRLLSGLEGASKSKEANKIAATVATVNRPVLFAYKNYKQLRENYNKLITINKVKPSEICVCGVNKTNPEAIVSYTNAQKPSHIRPGTKYVMCVQALLQNGSYKKFYPRKDYQLIIVDEFDYRLAVIPTLNYQLSRVADTVNRQKFVDDVTTWVEKSYSKEDFKTIIDLPNRKVPERYKKFLLTNWLVEEMDKTIVLTSEVLVTMFLQLLGFENHYLKSPDFKDRIINAHVSEHIVGEFYEVMNEGSGYWHIFNEHYDVIASDKYQVTEGNTLVKDQEVKVLNHTIVKGTNDCIGKRMLTILSHIPPQSLDEIYDMFVEFGDGSLTKEDVYTLFYRDRACQAVGRVLGNRGGMETDLLVNRRIYKSLSSYDDFPYTINPNYKLPCEELTEVLDKTRELKKRNRDYQKNLIEKKYEQSVNEIDNHFVKNPNANILVKDIKSYLLKHGIKSKYGKKNMPINTLLEHFQLELRQITLNGKRERVVVGLDYKQNEVSNND